MTSRADRSPRTPAHADPLRRLPSVDRLIRDASVAPLLATYARDEVLRAAREVLAERRRAIRAGRPDGCDPRDLASAVRRALERRARSSLRRVINATGVVLHTGLGRAPLADEALQAVARVASGYCNLELDLDTGGRGDRHAHARELLCELTGAADALVVNNNAAATYLTLNTLARGRGVIVSRGELVEIGGSYRMPDIMAAAGCRMIEVGTTNRTRIGDYERAIGADASVLLRVHTSNYRIVGFVEAASLEELVALARRHGLIVVDDLGSGLLFGPPPSPPIAGAPAAARRRSRTDGASAPARPGAGQPNAAPPSDAVGSRTVPTDAPTRWDEPTVRASIAAGADLTLFSGDKLLGGPQAGVIVGRAELIAELRANPLARALRPGKLTLAALEATLRLYREPDSLAERLPVLRMLHRSPTELRDVAFDLAERITRTAPRLQADCEMDQSYAGGGALPALAFPTWVVRVRDPRRPAARLAADLRERDVPIIARVQGNALLLDCRTLSRDELPLIAVALAESAADAPQSAD